MKNRASKRWRNMYGRKVPMIAAPGVGLIPGTTGATSFTLAVRAYALINRPGERLVRVPVAAWIAHVRLHV